MLNKSNKITADEVKLAELAAEQSRLRDMDLFVRLTLGDRISPNVDVRALLRRIDGIAPTDAQLDWSVVRGYWLLCRERTNEVRKQYEGIGLGWTSYLIFRGPAAYWALILLSIRAITGLRITSLDRLQSVLNYVSH